jgi:hypothetical protein
LTVVSMVEVMERRAAVVRVSPTEASNILADFQQQVTVDLETGCCLGYIGFRKGRVSFEWRASEISFPAGFDEGFFDPPAGRVVVDDPWPRHYGRLADLARAVPFALLVPRVLPEKADLFRADVARVGSSLMAHFAYRQSHTRIPRHLVFEEDARQVTVYRKSRGRRSSETVGRSSCQIPARGLSTGVLASGLAKPA